MEGTEVDYRVYGNRYKGIIVACVEDVGLTIVNKEDKNDYLLCITLPKSPNYSGKIPTVVTPLLYEVYDYVMNCVREGIVIDAVDIENIVGKAGAKPGTRPNKNSCAFNS